LDSNDGDDWLIPVLARNYGWVFCLCSSCFFKDIPSQVHALNFFVFIGHDHPKAADDLNLLWKYLL